MRGALRWKIALTAIAAMAVVGCAMFETPEPTSASHGIDSSFYQTMATRIEYPNPETLPSDDVAATPPPMTITNPDDVEYVDLRLVDVVRFALQESKVMRDLGGLVLRSPESVRAVQDPAIRETDPRFGVDAALSAFDANVTSNFSAEKNDQALNNIFLGGGTNLLQQDASLLQTEIQKKTAVGSEFSLRSNTDYDANNAPGNLFPSAWNTNIEAEFRHPLLQGSGVEFNRIAGPSEIPGVTTGVLIARTNTDISLADFEMGVRAFVSDLENAYWDLYFAYRDLDTRIQARDAALETWRRIHSLYVTGRRGGEAEKEAQSREQYFRLQEEVQNALTGRLIEGTRTNNGSSGGTFRSTSGVYVAERRLRLLMGFPISDGRLIRPAEEPLTQRVDFRWEDILQEALTQRAELRRQKWVVKQREMELVANHSFEQPRLDAVGQYRWRGFGRDLFYNGHSDLGNFNNAVENMFGGDFQEWQLGLELSFPIGQRRAHAAVRNAELKLARARAILKEQERSIAHDLSNAVAEKDRAFTVVQTSYNRRLAARQQLAAVQAAYEADQAPFNLVLEAQRRFAEAESHYYRMLVEYTLAVKNVHFEKGSLLEYCNVHLSEGPWPAKAYADASKLTSRRYEFSQRQDRSAGQQTHQATATTATAEACAGHVPFANSLDRATGDTDCGGVSTAATPMPSGQSSASGTLTSFAATAVPSTTAFVGHTTESENSWHTALCPTEPPVSDFMPRHAPMSTATVPASPLRFGHSFPHTIGHSTGTR